MSLRSLLLALLLCAATITIATAAEPTIGPAHGTLMVVGGGSMKSFWPTFLELAGGNEARLVVITTAQEAATGEDSRDVKDLRALGVKNLTVLHTRNREEADTEAFVAPLKSAQAVWFTGGRQWRLVDSYLNTRTKQELDAVLSRGGVIGGTSAGASIQASYLVRGAREGNTIMMAPGYEEGFGWLRDTAVDQHVNTRKRENDLEPVLQAHPKLLGIGLDEPTAIIVRQDRAEVVGTGVVRFHQQTEEGKAETVILKAGEVYDLAARRQIVAHSEKAAKQ